MADSQTTKSNQTSKKGGYTHKNEKLVGTGSEMLQNLEFYISDHPSVGLSSPRRNSAAM